MTAQFYYFGAWSQEGLKMVVFLSECVAISRIQMCHQRRIVIVGLIMCRLFLISAESATPRTRYNLCRPSVHKLCKIHSFRSGGNMAEACLTNRSRNCDSCLTSRGERMRAD